MLLLLALLYLPQGEPFGNDIKVDFTETVTYVNIPLKVQQRGLPYKGLNLHNLQVMENGVKVSLKNLSQVESSLTTHFLFDLSTSSTRHVYLAKRSVRDIIGKMKPQDRGKISFFSADYQPLTPYTSNKKVLQSNLGLLAPVGSTALYDAIAAALEELRKESGARALILFSDGHDLVSRVTEEDLAARARNYGIPIIFVNYGGSSISDKPLLAAQTRFMQQLALNSGGQVVDGTSAYQRLLTQQMKKSRMRYMLQFAPPGPENLEQWRSLVISINNCPDCQIEYRRAYQISALK